MLWMDNFAAQNNGFRRRPSNVTQMKCNQSILNIVMLKKKLEDGIYSLNLP